MKSNSRSGFPPLLGRESGVPEDIVAQLRDSALLEFRKQEPSIRERLSGLGLSEVDVNKKLEEILVKYEIDIRKKFAVAVRVEERARQASFGAGLFSAPIRQEPMSSEELSRRATALVEERARQDAEIHSRLETSKKQ